MSVTRFPPPESDFSERADTYTVAGNGTSAQFPRPLSKYSIAVKGTGAAATTWTVVLEISLEGTAWSVILTHQTSTGDGVVLSTGAADQPAKYMRSRCVAPLTLGGASDVVARILAVP